MCSALAWIGAAALVVVALVWFWFHPELLLVNTTVQEALPGQGCLTENSAAAPIYGCPVRFVASRTKPAAPQRSTRCRAAYPQPDFSLDKADPAFTSSWHTRGSWSA